METELPTKPESPRRASRETMVGLRARLRRSEMLLKLTQQVAAIDDLDQLLATIIELTANETDAERGSLFLNDPGSGELCSRVAQGTFNREIDYACAPEKKCTRLQLY